MPLASSFSTKAAYWRPRRDLARRQAMAEPVEHVAHAGGMARAGAIVVTGLRLAPVAGIRHLHLDGHEGPHRPARRGDRHVGTAGLGRGAPRDQAAALPLGLVEPGPGKPGVLMGSSHGSALCSGFKM
jgi:hypothetical protein